MEEGKSLKTSNLADCSCISIISSAHLGSVKVFHAGTISCDSDLCIRDLEITGKIDFVLTLFSLDSFLIFLEPLNLEEGLEFSKVYRLNHFIIVKFLYYATGT